MSFDYFNNVKDGAMYSFILSTAFTGAVTMNLQTAVASGAVSALASVLSSVALPILKKNGIDSLDTKMEIAKRTAVVILADLIFTGGKTTLRQSMIYLVTNAVMVFQQGTAFPSKGNEAFCHLKL